MIDGIETIPFSKTRNYVQRVMAARKIYRDWLTRGISPAVCGSAVAGQIAAPGGSGLPRSKRVAITRPEKRQSVRTGAA